MSNSTLIVGEMLTNNRNSPRNHAIDTITPHYMVWYCTGDVCAESFCDPGREASANYCIGKDGDIWLNVDEGDRAWTSASYSNDNRAITIECANYNETDGDHIYSQLPDATWEALVALCADICERNGKSRLVYTGGLDYDYLGDDAMLLTKHKWFQGTDCPGSWLDDRFDLLAAEVSARLSGEPIQPQGGGTLSRADMAAEVMEHYCEHDAHGYSQDHRIGNGTTERITLSDCTVVTIPGGDTDCSELVRRCYEAAGVLGGYWESYIWTGNEREVLAGAGFVEVGLDERRRGDVLWREGHTAIYLGGELVGEAHHGDFPGGLDGYEGDQDGTEVRVVTYRDSAPWTSCWRYAGSERDGYGKVIINEDWSDTMEMMYIINVADDHRINPGDDRTAMLKAGWQVLWTQSGGFKYLEHPDSVKLLVDNVKHFTGKDIPQLTSSSKAPFAFRLYQATALNAQNTVIKDRWPHQN